MRLLTLFLLSASTALAAVDHAKLLHAIAQVETGGDVRRGRAGEVSAWQMTPAVWLSYRGSAKERAAAHLRYLEGRVTNPTPYRLALAWNGGLGALKRPSTRTKDYAKRVENLYHD